MSIVKCNTKHCVNQARVSISTTRSRDRVRLYSVVDYDDQVSPKKATRYCKKCATELMIGLLDMLVHEDELEVKQPT